MSAPAAEIEQPRPGRVPLIEVIVSEAIDAEAVPRLRALLDEALTLRPERLVIDVAGCPTIDAAGVAVLLDIHRRAMRHGGRLTLQEPSPRLYRNLRLAHAAQVLDISVGRPPGAR